ncbi:MAG: hypothetical protein MGG11_03280 [Trichodesmium sp. MAG_R03]|nr:hypothetical protein [Trichodesmium sp. MAG_R03]
MDEHCLGLKPIFRRVWTSVGVQPTTEVNWRFQWFWFYGFVHPQSGANILMALALGQYYCF